MSTLKSLTLKTQQLANNNVYDSQAPPAGHRGRRAAGRREAVGAGRRGRVPAPAQHRGGGRGRRAVGRAGAVRRLAAAEEVRQLPVRGVRGGGGEVRRPPPREGVRPDAGAQRAHGGPRPVQGVPGPRNAAERERRRVGKFLFRMKLCELFWNCFFV